MDGKRRMTTIIESRRTRALRATVTLGAALSAVVLAAMPESTASPYDPHTPIPALSWCPGGGGSTGWGGYCECTSYPDGTRWNIAWGFAPFAGTVWQPMKCVVFTGSPLPPLAGPGGCGGAA